jgi:hypothetical protein
LEAVLVEREMGRPEIFRGRGHVFLPFVERGRPLFLCVAGPAQGVLDFRLDGVGGPSVEKGGALFLHGVVFRASGGFGLAPGLAFLPGFFASFLQRSEGRALLAEGCVECRGLFVELEDSGDLRGESFAKGRGIACPLLARVRERVEDWSERFLAVRKAASA